MLTLGFANVHYTIWEVFEETDYNSYIGEFKKTVYQFNKKSTKDYNKAIEEIENISGGNYHIDLTLKGTSSFVVEHKKVEHPEGTFQFGRSAGKEISTGVETIDYISWYFSESKDENAKKTLENEGFYVFDNGLVLNEEQYREHLETEEYNNFINSLIKGHHENDGEKVELNLKRIDGFSFEGAYGVCFIELYVDDNNRMFKYLGSSPNSVLNETNWKSDFIKIKATIKHTSYNGESETHLKRIKII